MTSTMQSQWNDAAAESIVAHYAAKGIARDLALRVYTTRLLGGDPRLVLHGGGNTSCKTIATDLVGDSWPVLCVKGSGWDMATIEPPGLPAVKLDGLRKARRLGKLSDEDMVALQRSNLIDPTAPNPSVETLLHAFLPHKFVDHTHSTAILSVVDQDGSRQLCQEIFGNKLGFVPYIMPGFDLAVAAADIYERDTKVEGLVLDKHGIFTFGDTAKQAYERMIRYVSLAEDYIARNGKPVSSRSPRPTPTASARDIAPVLRGAIAFVRSARETEHFVGEFRTSPQILQFVAADNLDDLARRGVSTPDLSIRIKTGAMVLPAPERATLAGYGKIIRDRVATFAADYKQYFERNNARVGGDRTMLDPMPRLTLVPGLGLFGHGRTLKDARIAADCAEMWIEAILGAEAIGEFRPLPHDQLFDLEYWSLEQAKLKSAKPKILTGQVMSVTGGAGAIGRATAKLFAANGAHVAILDLDKGAAEAAAKQAGNDSIGLACDVTNRDSVRAAFDAVIETYGGADIVVSNAGAAWEGGIGEIDDALLRKSFELNFFAHQTVAQHAVNLFKQQGTGGVLLFNASKQAVNPGANFGAYGAPKAATLFLSRQYALEYGKDGIRVNAVNADRIRSGLLTDKMIESRSAARGLSTADYMSGNLLGQEVTADDVAQAFLHQTLAERTTADVTTVDGGNIAAALR
jgi:rhamnose utilization protein RhaD (predicted bifunctional aldolase and dehydrogenase)/NAD(P)-dependent dehydrogenase (short-subunit alcohol dehydrogenase family)